MLIKFFNETTVIMYRRESSRRTETKKLFIKLAANGRETDWLRGIFPLILSQPLSWFHDNWSISLTWELMGASGIDWEMK